MSPHSLARIFRMLQSQISGTFDSGILGVVVNDLLWRHRDARRSGLVKRRRAPAVDGTMPIIQRGAVVHGPSKVARTAPALLTGGTVLHKPCNKLFGNPAAKVSTCI